MYFYDNYCKSFAMIDSIFFNVRLLLGSYYYYNNNNDDDSNSNDSCVIFTFVLNFIFFICLIFIGNARGCLCARKVRRHPMRWWGIFDFKCFMLWYAIKYYWKMNLVSCILFILQILFMIFFYCCSFNKKCQESGLWTCEFLFFLLFVMLRCCKVRMLLLSRFESVVSRIEGYFWI